MAPHVPEEVDVFSIPHSRMKGLVNAYAEMIKKTNFTNDTDLQLLLESLLRTFMEFKCHEQIENQLIMKKLKNKLKQLSIQNSAVCNCHNDDDLGRMMSFIKAGYKKKTSQDRLNFGLKLVKALEDFTETFIPHMKEEEEVFQPMLLQYFSYEELCELKKKVIQQHITKEQQLLLEQFRENNGHEYKDFGKEKVQDEKEEDTYCEAFRSAKQKQAKLDVDGKCYVDSLPPEIKLQVLSYLKPPDLCGMAVVSKEWQALSRDPLLWPELHPVAWAKGKWVTRTTNDSVVEDDEADEDVSGKLPNMEDADCFSELDIDADVDETESDIVKEVKCETEILQGLTKHVLPKAGVGVKKLVLKNSRALTNSTLSKIIYLCPNLEVLDLTQTRTSDAGLKRIGKNSCGSKLRVVILSGCGNITDATLMRLAVAQHQSLCGTNNAEAPYNIDPRPATEWLGVAGKVNPRIVEQVEPEKLDAVYCVDSGGGECVCHKDKAQDACNHANGPTMDNDKMVYGEEMNGWISKEQKNDCNASLNARVDQDSGDKCMSDIMDARFDGGQDEVMVQEYQDEGRYDVDCLCEMYYRECNILIDGGCQVSTHHCRKISAPEPNYSKIQGNFDSQSEVKAPYPAVNMKGSESVEEIKSPVHVGNERQDRDRDQVDKNGGSIADGFKTRSNDEKPCHSCCGSGGGGEADDVLPVSAIEECVPLTRRAGTTQTLDEAPPRFALRHLNFSGCFQITDVGLRALGQIGEFPWLTHLDLSGCLRISGQGLYTLVDACTHLQPDDLYYCDNIVDGPHADEASGCQNLECGNRVCCRSGH